LCLDVHKERPGLTISEGHGLTDASSVVTGNGLDSERDLRMGQGGPDEPS
jgi:hypothetical protein